MFNPFGPNWRFFLIAALAGLATWLWSQRESRGDTITFLEGVVTRQSDTLFFERNHVTRLVRDSTRLAKSVAYERQKVSDRDLQLKEGENEALRTDESILAGKQQVNRLVNAMTAIQKKQAADAGLRSENLSYAGAGISEADTATNSRIAKLTAYGKVYHDSTQALKRVNGQQREKIAQQFEKISNQEGMISELEADLNGIGYGIQNEFHESQKEKHPLGFGQKKSKERLRKKVLALVAKP